MKIGLVTGSDDLEKCFMVRRAVFMEEQGVTDEEEWDGLDKDCRHYLAQNANGPTAVARALPKGKAAKIQRVAVLKPNRGTGLGRQLMLAVLEDIRQEGFQEAVLDSQSYAIPFYQRLGFVAKGPEFDDAGIPHRRMSLLFKD
ncbi:MAG: putative GNAT family N-acyltransferase [Paracoccaceae bacterium]|jgi:predicted GNAT family N-acyltransferase